MVSRLTVLVVIVVAANGAAAANRPNVVVMMTDDQRHDALSCAGNTVLRTPHLDRLANEGARFSNMFVTNALCAPSRLTLLSGLYAHQHGIPDNLARRVRPDLVLLPDLLRQAGYEVAFVGKSHVQGALRDRTWDYYFGFVGQGIYHNPLIAEGTKGKDLRREGYMDDVLTDHALRWLEQRTGDKPFCLFLFFKAPHRSWQRARRHHDLFSGVAIPKPETYDADLTNDWNGKPRAFIHADNKIGDFDDVRTLEGFVKDYYATITAVDENVGRVLDGLEKKRILDDTVVLFTSDNGFFQGEWRRFDKRFMHEPSIRVPLLVRYPRRIAANTVPNPMALNIDLAPTILQLADVKPPASMQGKSLVPLLEGTTPADWRKDWLYAYYEYPIPHQVRRHRGVRTERHKLIHYYDEPEEFELYDLRADPKEIVNLADRPEHQGLKSQLRKRLEELRQEYQEPSEIPPPLGAPASKKRSPSTN